MKIRFVKHKDIDRNRWDELIRQSPQALFFGLSVVYDTLCKNWDALVLGDYEAVMPLPNRRKFGLIPYICQPYFVQQSGVFSKEAVSAELLENFIRCIPKKFVRVNYHFNYGNDLSQCKPSWIITPRRSYEIDLQAGYENIRKCYNKDCIKNLKKLEKPSVFVRNDIETECVISVYREAYGSLNPKITPEKYAGFARLVALFDKEGMIEKTAVYENETLLACGLFVKAFGRIHYCLGAPTKQGRKLNATHLLIDSVIKKFSGQALIFDFEGSEIPNVAAFYKKFNPQENRFWVFERGV